MMKNVSSIQRLNLPAAFWPCCLPSLIALTVVRSDTESCSAALDLAVLGAFVMQRARSWWSADAIISVGIASFGVTTIVAGALRALLPLGAVMLIGGAAWISFISLLNVQVLNQTPDWVRARVLAVSMLVFQGAVAAGSATWGAVAARVGLGRALLWAGLGAILSTVLGLFLRLGDVNIDLTPWNHWRLPSIVDADGEAGPVLVTVEYRVDPEHVSEFI
jgi:hypothetical protein